jgi:hypothetical protein
MKMTGKRDGLKIAGRIRRALAGRRAITEKRMMGGVCFLFVWVDPEACDARALRAWIALAERYVRSLPKKR